MGHGVHSGVHNQSTNYISLNLDMLSDLMLYRIEVADKSNDITNHYKLLP